MALTKTRTLIRAAVRRFTDTGGTNALVRHPDADLNDYIDRALGSLHRKLNEFIPDLRVLSSSSISITSGTTSYSLPADFEALVSVDLTANGVKVWLEAYEMHERASLTDSGSSYSGVPQFYRLRGSNIEYLPSPTSSYTSVIWYVPTPTQFSADAETFDTINRLDDYLVAYASRFVAVKDKNIELVALCRDMMAELEADIALVARNRDRNSPPRVVDEWHADRWGRRRGRYR